MRIGDAINIEDLRAIAILADELDCTLALTGSPDIAALIADLIAPA